MVPSIATAFLGEGEKHTMVSEPYSLLPPNDGGSDCSSVSVYLYILFLGLKLSDDVQYPPVADLGILETLGSVPLTIPAGLSFDRHGHGFGVIFK